jgi:uncharacterized OB-fold protein
MNEYERPLPEITTLNRPHWEAAKQHQYLIQRCQQCGHQWFPPMRTCTECLSDQVEWVQAKGTGSVYSFVIYHQGWLPGYLKQTPYNLAIVELDEGIRVVTNLVGIDNDAIEVGMPVEVMYEHIAPEVVIPRFQLRK